MIGQERFRIREGKKRLPLLFLRIFLAFIVFLLIYHSKDKFVLYFFVLTTFVAFLDGFLAKREEAVSQLRSILDPFADKLLINLTAVALLIRGNLPFWVMAVYMLKDLLVISGALFALSKNAKIIFRPNMIDKVAVFTQLLALFLALMDRLDYIIIWVSVFFIALSFAVALLRSGVRIVRYKTDLEEIRFRKLVKLPDIFTLLNAFSGMMAILFAISESYYFAIGALLAAAVFDYIDGKVARLVKRAGEFGKQLDSLADTISFGVAPAIFGFTLIQTNLAIIVFALFLFAGVLRLARYNIMEFNVSGEFAGMPITVNGIVIPLIYVLQVPAKAYPYIYLFLAILMVSPLKFKKMF